MLKEDVLDLTHFGYMHRNSLKMMDWDKPSKVEADDSTVTYAQEFSSAPLAFVYDMPSGIGTTRTVYRKN